MAWNSLNSNLNLVEHFQGFFSLILAYILLHCFSLNKIRKLLGKVKQRLLKEISYNEAIKAWVSIRKSQRLLVSRVACLELSLAFVIFALLKRKNVIWCIGAKLNPFEAHAWIELGGKPFQEPDCVERQFKKLFIV